MLEVEKALAELERRREDLERQIRLERRYEERAQNAVKIRALESQVSLIYIKHSTMKKLDLDVKQLEYSLSFKMMTRYPENQSSKNEWRRELHRKKRRLTDMAGLYQPKEKAKPRYAAA